MEDAQNQNNLAIDLVEDPVSAVTGGADQMAKFWLSRADFWMATQKIEGLPEAARKFIGNRFAERVRTKSVDLFQVAFGRWA